MHQNNAAISAAAMRTLPNIAREWELTADEMARLLGMDVQIYQAWSEDPDSARLMPGQRERASYVLGIYKALMILMPLTDHHPRWLRHPNTGAPFQGVPPLDYLLEAGLTGLDEVRRHLDAIRQGGHA